MIDFWGQTDPGCAREDNEDRLLMDPGLGLFLVADGMGGAAAGELTKIAEVSFTEGESGILELLDAHRTAARARIRVIDMRLAARLAQIALERVVGDTIWP